MIMNMEDALKVYVMVYDRQAFRKNGIRKYPDNIYLTKDEYEYLEYYRDERLVTFSSKDDYPSHFMGIPIVVIDEEDNGMDPS